MLRRNIRQSVRHELAGVWVTGPVPTDGAVLAPNHHSWWDGYLLAELAWQLAQPIRIMMTEVQLARFPFLRLLGAMNEREVRGLIRAAQAGAWAIVFPEGAIRPQGTVGLTEAGAAWVAGRAQVPLVPVALRVVMRGAQWPEAFVRFGPPCPGDSLPAALNELLAQLDADLARTSPDHPPSGYLRWVQGQASTHDEVSLASRWLTRLAGFNASPGGPARRERSR